MAAVARPKDSVDEGLGRYLAPLGAVLGLILIVVGVVVMKDPLAGQHLLANIYDVLGNTAGAEALRNNQGDVFPAKLLLAVVALVVGVGGIWMLFTGASAIVGLFSPRIQSRVLPWVFVTPALLLLTVYLIYPTIATFFASFTENLAGGDPLTHYKAMFTGDYLAMFRNNIIWLIVGTAGSVGLGLVIAGLVDRVRREALAKTFIFLPLAISLVGASVIWRFVYQWRPEGPAAVRPAQRHRDVPRVRSRPMDQHVVPGQHLALIVIFVWLQTGFAMVVLSAAIKGVSVEVIEAARLDGAGERQIFFGIIVPIIKGSIITVATTIAIAVLKIFDIVYVMTAAGSTTDVVAEQDVPGEVPVLQRRPRGGAGGGPVPGRPADDVRSTSATCDKQGVGCMTAPAQSVAQPRDTGQASLAARVHRRSAPAAHRGHRDLLPCGRLPTLGLFVTSFRNPLEITQTGWWDACSIPIKEGQWTLANYGSVLGSRGHGQLHSSTA